MPHEERPQGMPVRWIRLVNTHLASSRQFGTYVSKLIRERHTLAFTNKGINTRAQKYAELPGTRGEKLREKLKKDSAKWRKRAEAATQAEARAHERYQSLSTLIARLQDQYVSAGSPALTESDARKYRELKEAARTLNIQLTELSNIVM